jgi:hypothetical protein
MSSVSFAQTLSQQGCDLYAGMAASGVLERSGKLPKGATMANLAAMGIDLSQAPGRINELLTFVFNKTTWGKLTPEQIYQKELARCLKAGGDVNKLIPGKV